MTHADHPEGGEGRVLAGESSTPGAVRDDDQPALPPPVEYGMNGHRMRMRVYRFDAGTMVSMTLVDDPKPEPGGCLVTGCRCMDRHSR